MLVKEIKPITKVGKDLLKDKSADEIIELIIEKPLQKACKECREKNIETVMSSANKNNVVKSKEKVIKRSYIIEKNKQHKVPTFYQAGKGYAWIMINYKTLSEENKKIMYSLEKELGEETIWFAQPYYIPMINSVRKIFKLKPIFEDNEDIFDSQFKEKQLVLMYSNIYPTKSIFIRMPIDENTKVEDVEIFFSNIISKLNKQ